jgi:hypothetical protein
MLQQRRWRTTGKRSKGPRRDVPRRLTRPTDWLPCRGMAFLGFWCRHFLHSACSAIWPLALTCCSID